MIGVGGTTLQLNSDNTIQSETGWSGSGGGTSSYESTSSYQSSLGYPHRAIPDVAYDADLNTGFAVYDSFGGYGWVEVGGTSAGAPQWAGLIAIADQGRVVGGKTTLSSTQALTALYSLSASDFHDITSGYNGYFATQGYDLVTGLGTPVANRVIADLVSANFVSGGSATSQVSRPVAHGFTRRTSPRLDVTSSPANGTENSSSLLGSGQFAGADRAGLGTQVGITQAQPVVNQAVIATQITQAPAPARSLGQSLLEQPQYPTRSTGIEERAEPDGLIQNTTPVQSPTPDQEEAPTPDQAPATEPPSTPPPVEPAQPMDDLAKDHLDLALALVNSSMAARRLEPLPAPSTDLEKAPEAQPAWSVSTLAGTAAVAAGGYRLVLGWSDRIRRRWLAGRFASMEGEPGPVRG